MKTDKNGIPLCDGALVVLDEGFQTGTVDLSTDPGTGFVWVLFDRTTKETLCEAARLVRIDCDDNWISV